MDSLKLPNGFVKIFFIDFPGNHCLQGQQMEKIPKAFHSFVSMFKKL